MSTLLILICVLICVCRWLVGRLVTRTCRDETAGWIELQLGTRVGVVQCHTVLLLDGIGNPATR